MDIDKLVEEAIAEGIAEKRDVLRFLSYIREEFDDCWYWTGSKKQPPGLPYGFFGLEGKSRLAHRVSYEWWVDDLNDDLEIHHKCENPSCVNPDHLYQVTRLDNLMFSSGVTAENARKTTCPKGHLYSGVNSQGRRICKICQREANERSRRRSGVKPKNELRHGTLHMYTKYNCRCEKCREAKRKSR